MLVNKYFVPVPSMTSTAPYRAGFIECTTSIVSFLARDDSMDAETKIRLLNHLTNYLVHSEDTQRSKLAFQTSCTAIPRAPWTQPMFTREQLPRLDTSVRGPSPAPVQAQTAPFCHPHTVASVGAVLARAHGPLTSEELLCHNQGRQIHYGASIPNPPRMHKPRPVKQPPSTVSRWPSSPLVKLEKTRLATDTFQTSGCTVPAMYRFGKKLSVHRQAFMPLETNGNIMRQQAVRHSDTLRHTPYHKQCSNTPVNQYLRRVTNRLDFDRSKYSPSANVTTYTENILNGFPLYLDN